MKQQSKFPLDESGIQANVDDIVRSHTSQNEIIKSLSKHLRTAMGYVEDEDTGWYKDAYQLLCDIQDRKIMFENLRFDQSNGHRLGEMSPYGQRDYKVEPYKEPQGVQLPIEISQDNNIKIQPTPNVLQEPIQKVPKKRSELSPTQLKQLEEIESWEKKQDNSNDIYKISARVKNLAREGGAALTDVGVMLCNTYIHVLKSLYDFAENIPDRELRMNLIEKIRSHENMPGNFIAATHSGVRIKHEEKMKKERERAEKDKKSEDL